MGRRKLLIAGNSTMPRSVGIFNLPALETCTPSPWCEEHCYALHNRYKWASVRSAYTWRWAMTIREGFSSMMINEIANRTSLQWIRVHISGDFYDESYVEKWAVIAKAFPDTIFRTNTKRQDLLPLMVDRFPQNFVVRESIDVTREATGLVPTAAIVGTPHTDDHFVCSNDCEACNFHCWTHPKVNVRTAIIL